MYVPVCIKLHFCLGVVCVKTTKNCPRLFYSSALFVWPYADEVQTTTFSNKIQWIWPPDCQNKMDSWKLEACSEQKCLVEALNNFEGTSLPLESCESYSIYLKPHTNPYKHIEYLWSSEISTLPVFTMDTVTGYDHIKVIIDQVFFFEYSFNSIQSGNILQSHK